MSQKVMLERVNKKESKQLWSLGRSKVLSRYACHWDLLLLLLPGFIALVIFNYLPMYGILIAFKDYRMLDGVWKSPWVGFENFSYLFGNSDFWIILRNTFSISILKLIFGFPAPIILALMLNEMRNVKYKRIVQTISYLPHFFSWVVLGGIMMMIFSSGGPINIILQALGMSEPIQFFGDKGMFLVLLVSSAVWQNVGWGSIVYLAALSGVDESLYEAAYIDGAGRWKQTIHISIPTIAPTIVTVLILSMGSILNAGFDQIYNLYNPTVYEVSDIIDTYVLRRMQSMDYTLATTTGLFKSVVGLVLVVSTNFFVNKFTGGEQGIW